MATLKFNDFIANYDDSDSSGGTDGAGTGSGGTCLPIVLIHGGATTHRYWDGVRREIPDTYRTVAPDLFGCGSTPPWNGAGPLGHDEEAILIRAMIDEVGPSVHLVGHSYGAAACLRAAIAKPHGVQSITLIEPPIYRLLEQARETELYNEISAFRSGFTDLAAHSQDAAAMELLVDRFNGTGTWAAMSERAHDSLLSVVESLVHGFTANAEDRTTLEDCNGLEIPTLLPWGELSGEPERMMVAILNQNLPDSRTVSLAGAMHQSPLTHPNVVAGLIVEHVSRH